MTKCIICDKKAEYTLKGNSYCKKHLEEQNFNDFTTMHFKRREYKNEKRI